MDYDENDFQNQNHNLAGEGSNKVPPVLNPYALPKFDFDDSHLRFDSLVETEVFLGIESHEDNRWIEDFSRGSCGIDFNKGAEESCPISRCNNVWSEATSSESVEMLLKSVGQEENIPKQNTVEASDAFDELGCLTKRMEPDQRNEEIFSEIVDVQDLQPALSLEEAPEDSSGKNDNLGMNQFHAEVSLPIDHGESVENNSGVLEIDTVGKLHLAGEGNLFEGATCSAVSKPEAGNLATDHARIDPEVVITCSGIKVDVALRDTDNVIVEDKLKIQECPNPTNDFSMEDDDSLQKNKNLLSEELLALENNTELDIKNTDGNQQNMDSDVMNQQNSNNVALENITSHLVGAAEVESNMESTSDATETSVLIGDTHSVKVQECEEETVKDDSLKGTGTTCQSEKNVDMGTPTTLEADEGFGIQHAKAVSSVDRQSVGEKCKSIDRQSVGGELVGSSMPSSYPVQEKVGDGDADRGRTCDTNEVQMDTVAADAMGSSEVGVPVEIPNVESQGLSSAHADSGSMEAQVNGQDDAPNPDSVSVCREESITVFHNLSNKNDTSGIPVTTEEAYAEPSISESGNKTDAIADHEEVCKSAEVALQSTQLEVDIHAEVEASRGDLPTKVSGSDIAAEKASHSASVETACVPSEKSLGTSIPECVPTVEADIPESPCKSQTTETRVSNEFSSTVEVAVNLVDPSKGENCVEAAINPEKAGPSTAPEQCEMEADVSGDASKAIERTIIPAGPLPEGVVMSDAPEDAMSHRDSDKSSSDIQLGSINGSLPVNGKEKEGSEVFKVQDIAVPGDQEHAGKDGPPVPDGASQKELDASKNEKSSLLKIGEASPSTPGPVQAGPRVQRSGKRGSPQIVDKESRSSKGTTDRKPRKTTVKSAGRASGKKGNLVKDASPLKPSELVGKSTNVSVGPSVSLGPSGIFQFVQPNEILHHGQMEGLGTKPFGALTTPPSSLPDLNSSAFPSLVFQQPFNDMQQVQLRAQILVYGSIISRQTPEELHMVSAFGGSDGGRSVWEKAWRTCKAKLSAQTPPVINLETPNLSRSDVSSKQTKATPSPAGRASTSGTSTPGINPIIPLSSPLWNLPTPSHDALQSSGLPRGSVMDYQPVFSQFAPHQPQPIISYVGHGATWMSQTPFRGPWAASPQTPAPNASIRFPSLQTESVQLTPVRDSSFALLSGMKHVPPGPLAQTGVLPGSTVKDSPSHDLAKVIGQSGRPSADPKLKKRKKGQPSEDQSKIILQSQPHIENLPVTTVASFPSASATAATPTSFLPKSGVLEFSAVASPLPSAVPVKELDQSRKNPVLSDEVLGKMKEARQHAVDAAALAAAAVSHSQEVWNELDKKKVSGSLSASEAKLCSAAVAIAAAAAVAKAAAAAANVASNAALQAKAMADEAFADGTYLNLDDGNSIGGGGISASSSIIFAAKEASRRRIEAASAAALRAENLDIIVKAAELAAEAITQAGKVVTMGDPLLLGKLAEAGPEGFWKLPLTSLEQASKLCNANIEHRSSEKLVAGSTGPKKSLEGPPDDMVAHSTLHTRLPASEEILRNPMEGQVRLIVGISGSISSGDENRMGQQLPTTSEAVKTTGVNAEGLYELRSQDIEGHKEPDKAEVAKRDDGIQEGSRVEVFKDGDEYKGAWFSADVVSLKDGKAYVCYTALPSTKGSDKLQEWVDLEGAEDKAPKIRIPHPMTAVQFDGTKKRRRAAVGSFTCSVGDKVDAWIRDSWWEGVVIEKSKKDESSVTVQFPVTGKTSVIKAWHIRPSLIWNDGKWIEWLGTRENDHSHHEGDTPKEKRAKLGSSGRQANPKDKRAKTVEDPDSVKPEDPKSLDLSDGEKVFNIGKGNADEGKPRRGRAVRSGIRKQGPGVVFGVPKPGKKRKFMEVSKHYGDDNCSSKAEVSDSVKLANYMMPRGTGLRGLKSAPRKENEAAEPKARVPVTVKPRALSGRTASQKYSSKSSAAAPGDTDRIGKTKDSSGNVGRSFFGSELTTGGAISFSARAGPSDGTASKKISAPKSNPVNRDKPATSGKLDKIEEDKVMNSNSQNEPRRSNRRIQPTSRLLEGLQSSLIISKVPSSSYDKGQRSVRGGAKGN